MAAPQVVIWMGYVAMHAMLWLDLRYSFIDKQVEEWEAQKAQTCALNNLEQDTEVVYWACTIKRQEDKALTDSKEGAAKELLPRTTGGSCKKAGKCHA